jgi:hypothetical protein
LRRSDTNPTSEYQIEESKDRRQKARTAAEEKQIARFRFTRRTAG